MNALLTVILGPDRGRTFTISGEEKTLIGRGENTQTRLRDDAVSRVHCVAQLEGKKALLTDSGSKTGTKVNGKSITEHVLQTGDVIEIGATKLSFEWLPEGSQGRRYSTLRAQDFDTEGPSTAAEGPR
jgi:pSer/pThr/pTyr-binding forkhead associated (FHA) protein